MNRIFVVIKYERNYVIVSIIYEAVEKNNLWFYGQIKSKNICLVNYIKKYNFFNLILIIFLPVSCFLEYFS